MTEREQVAAMRLILEARDLMWYVGNGTTDEELNDMAERLHSFFDSLPSETKMLVIK